jgi:hypothetical protein
MKKILVTLITIAIAGCTNQTKILTETEKESIIKEVKKDFYAMVEACNNADLNNALQLYWNSPEFLGIASDGSIVDYQQFKKGNEEYFGSIASQKFVTVKESFKFLDDNHILSAWQGTNEAILKSGEKMAFSSFGATSIFKKIDGSWKVIYFHESGLPPTVTNSSANN